MVDSNLASEGNPEDRKQLIPGGRLSLDRIMCSRTYLISVFLLLGCYKVRHSTIVNQISVRKLLCKNILKFSYLCWLFALNVNSRDPNSGRLSF